MADDSASQGSYLPQLLRRGTALAAAGCAFVAGCSAAGGGETRYENSPQFRDGVFQNMANPDEKPSASAWRIWSRFIVGSKVDTVPVDAIPCVKSARRTWTRSTPRPTTWCAWATRRTCSSCAASTG
jgi:hypothetical protein